MVLLPCKHKDLMCDLVFFQICEETESTRCMLILRDIHELPCHTLPHITCGKKQRHFSS